MNMKQLTVYLQSRISNFEMQKKGLGANFMVLIFALILGIIGLVIYLNMQSSLIPTGATAFHNLSDNLGGLGDVIGTDAATFALTMDEIVGFLWVAFPLLTVVGVLVGFIFVSGRSISSGGGQGRRNIRRRFRRR